MLSTYVMPSMSTYVFRAPKGIALDLSLFNKTSVPSSKVRSIGCTSETSVEHVNIAVMSSA
jgi:hypothetical protein